MYFINPEIISNSSNDATYEEGCLSVPNQFAEINRPDKCQIKFLDYDGIEQVLNAEGLLATCIQHEMDHLEGILFIDYLSKLKKNMIIKKLSKQKKSIERIAF
jgi:peptide deformylase